MVSNLKITMSYNPQQKIKQLLKKAKKALKPPRTQAQKEKYLIAQSHKMDRNPTKPELLFMQILDELDIRYETQKIVSGKIFDFYIPVKNMLVETDGVYWHAKDVEQKNMSQIQKKSVSNDKKKDVIAKGLGYLIERVWEDDLEKDYEAVKNRFKNIIHSE